MYSHILPNSAMKNPSTPRTNRCDDPPLSHCWYRSPQQTRVRYLIPISAARASPRGTGFPSLERGSSRVRHPPRGGFALARKSRGTAGVELAVYTTLEGARIYPCTAAALFSCLTRMSRAPGRATPIARARRFRKGDFFCARGRASSCECTRVSSVQEVGGKRRWRSVELEDFCVEGKWGLVLLLGARNNCSYESALGRRCLR